MAAQGFYFIWLLCFSPPYKRGAYPQLVFPYISWKWTTSLCFVSGLTFYLFSTSKSQLWMCVRAAVGKPVSPIFLELGVLESIRQVGKKGNHEGLKRRPWCLDLRPGHLISCLGPVELTGQERRSWFRLHSKECASPEDWPVCLLTSGGVYRFSCLSFKTIFRFRPGNPWLPLFLPCFNLSPLTAYWEH